MYAIFVFQNHQDIIVHSFMKFGKAGEGGRAARIGLIITVVFAVLLEVRYLDSCHLSFSVHLWKCFSTGALQVC